MKDRFQPPFPRRKVDLGDGNIPEIVQCFRWTFTLGDQIQFQAMGNPPRMVPVYYGPKCNAKSVVFCPGHYPVRSTVTQ